MESSERTFRVELLQRDEDGKIPVPIQVAKPHGVEKAGGVLLLELGGRDSTSSGLSDFLYSTEVSNGQSSEVYQVRATMSWSGRKDRPSVVTKKVRIPMSDENSPYTKLTV